ncbi:hypothetical protein AMTR_s00024p00137700 [Amborella trichopoda]|uniref:Uncharacterized protein n=1 Tax=Amborella trichopoda TaxID=13333 RepID=W1PSR7_AMBTC|nr:hypothetical protein AMTR_s00024p00137700 [Amborella trichopoda]
MASLRNKWSRIKRKPQGNEAEWEKKQNKGKLIKEISKVLNTQQRITSETDLPQQQIGAGIVYNLDKIRECKQ